MAEPMSIDILLTNRELEDWRRLFMMAMEPTLIDILLTNLKHHPWHLYPDYKIDEATGKALIELLEKADDDVK